MRNQYYCKVCEEFFPLEEFSPKRCPHCFRGAEFILGPYPISEYFY